MPQFVVSGAKFNMNFLLLCIQSLVCVACVAAVKRLGIISFRNFDVQDAKTWFPISFMLVSVIYTGSKSLARLCHYFCLLQTNKSRYLATFEHTGVHNFQESDHHFNCASFDLCIV